MAAPSATSPRLTGVPARRRWSPQTRYIALGLKIFDLNRKLDALERRSMARVRWKGEEFTAEPVSQNADGSWNMRALQATARTAPGTTITVKANEIVAGTMPVAGEAPTPAPADSGQAALDAGMAAERKTLVTPAELIAQHQQKNAESQGATGAVPGGPTQAPAGAQASNQGTKPMTHLADKMKLLATGTSGFAAQLEKMIDDKLAAHTAAQAQVLNDVGTAFATVDAITADAQSGVQAIQAELKNLTNQ